MTEPDRPDHHPDFSFLHGTSADESESVEPESVEPESVEPKRNSDAAEGLEADHAFSIDAQDVGAAIPDTGQVDEMPAVATSSADDSSSDMQRDDLPVDNSTVESADADMQPLSASVHPANSPKAAESPAVEDESHNHEQKITQPDVTGSDTPESAVAQVHVPSRVFNVLAGYAAAVTFLLGFLFATGRISLSGQHPLESLPDLQPLQQNQFQVVPPDTELPEGHVLKLKESQRYGDVILTPLRVTRESLSFQNMISQDIDAEMTTRPVLKLWLRFENVSRDVAFPPWDVGFMAHRSPPSGRDESTLANSWLQVEKTGSAQTVRVLNYLHSPESSFDIVGHHSARMIGPGESMETFIASDESISDVSNGDVARLRWRIQFRKGIHRTSRNGVTTLVDIDFHLNDVVQVDG